MPSVTASALSAKWWTFLVRGILAFILAAIVFAAPATAVVSLVVLFGSYFVISGVAAFIAGFSMHESRRWWALLIMGPLQIIIGIAVFVEPAAGALSLAFLFAIWMIMTGALEISSAVALRNTVPGEFWSVLLGVITLAFGLFVSFDPALSILALVYTVGFYAILAGMTLVGLAFRVRGIDASVAPLRRAA